MQPRPFGNSFCDAVSHYLKTNNLTRLSQINREVLADLAQQFHDHWTKTQAAKKKRGEALPEEISIYEAYPRKVARADALVAIRSALAKIDYEELKEKTRHYCLCVGRWPQGYRYKEGRDLCPHPATWFNRESYLENEKEWLPAGMFTRPDDPQQAVNRPEAGPLLEPAAGWRETVKTHEDLHIFQGRSWDTINDYYKRAIIKLCSP